jgi:hypothetical protein
MNVMWLEQVFYVVMLLGFIPIFHECGHAFYLTEKLNKKVKVEQNWKRLKFAILWQDDGKLKRTQYFDIAMWGILAGMIPFFIFNSVIDFKFFLPLFITYLIFSCRHDWIEMWRIYKKKEG